VEPVVRRRVPARPELLGHELERYGQHVHQFRVVDVSTMHVVFSTAADEPVYQGPRPTAWARLLEEE
jgi:hypothetical protein